MTRKRALPVHGVTREQAADEQRRRLFERDQRAPSRRPLRQHDEALDLVRHADERIHRLAVADARQLQRDREAEIGNERERMRRIDRERRQHRKDVMQEMIFEPDLLLLGDVGAVDQHDAVRLRVRRATRASAPAGRSRAPTPLRRSRGSCSDGVSPSGLRSVMPSRTWPLRAGDAHHEEFVEVVGRDRQEAQPLEQRMAFGSAASSSTRRLKCSQDNSRLMKRSGLFAMSCAAAASGCGVGRRILPAKQWLRCDLAME